MQRLAFRGAHRSLIRLLLVLLAFPLVACAGARDSDSQAAATANGAAGTAPAPAGVANAGPGSAAQAGTGPAGAPSPSAAGASASAPSGGGGAAAEPRPAGAAGAAPTQGGDNGEGYDYEAEQVALDSDLVIASGETLRVGPGTTFTASANVKVLVQGTLVITGTSEARVRFLGAGMPRSWHGIVVASGGALTATQVEIGGATYGIHAEAGSSFTVDHAEIGTSFKAAVLQANGSFDHTRFHASGDPTFSPVNEVSIEDVNGTLTILDASPTISNSSFDGSAALVDMIRVGGNASPVFDHIHVKDAHCGIHANGGVNTSPTVRNSVFMQLAYGLMAYATKPIVEDSVFMNNSNDFGFCFDATAENAPALRNNYYSSGEVIVDPTCFQIGTTDASPAAVPNPSAGPAGL
jgi:hypothetical protein